MSNFKIRQAVPEDITPAYVLFRRSLFDYLYRMGVVGFEAAQNPPIRDAWLRQSSWIQHLWDTAKENWVAVDETGRLTGWALTIERGGHLELSVFFVEPSIQGKGVGRALLEKVLSRREEQKLTINATQDPRALSIYFRTGVRFVSTSVDLIVRAGKIDRADDLDFVRLIYSEEAVDAVVALETAVLGFSRRQDIRFLLKHRPAWLALRGGKPVGYVFGVQPNPAGVVDFAPGCGPMAAIQPSDFPALIDHVIREGSEAEDFTITVPLANHHAFRHLLSRGAKIDPLYMMALTDSGELAFDRYIHTSPAFIV